jgi:hypothetical protein
MLIPQVEVAEFFDRCRAAGPGYRCVLTSMKICRLIKVSLECLFLVRAEVVNLPLDLLAVLSCGMQSQGELVRTCLSSLAFIVLLL